TPGLAAELNSNQATFADNPTMLAVVTQLKELYDMDCFGDNALSDTYEGTADAMASGKYAMTVYNVTGQQEFLDSFTAEKRGTVYQTAVKYVNPQWMDIGKDLVAMFTGDLQPADILKN